VPFSIPIRSIDVEDLKAAIDRVATETEFSGVVRVDDDGETFARAYGFANRGHGIANTVETQFGIASGTKALTALTIVSLVEDGQLDLRTPVRSVLGPDLPLIDDGVTVEQLLAHRSGIGDYLDEDEPYDVVDYVLRVPVHELATSEQYLAVLDGYPAKFAPGARFSYCNSGYVVLALVAERITRTDFHDLVEQRVCAPAGMTGTAFLRSDEPNGRAAIGYLNDGPRTNVLHLPVRGSGDGGIFSTASDIHALWTAFFAGRIVSGSWVAEMIRRRSETPNEGMRYGLGFWIAGSSDGRDDRFVIEGSDAGVSFRSTHDPATRATRTVLSNTSRGAWPVARILDGSPR
jgi:CubicO group peptidase (beta-lactamase class C family)